jgi:hypothetical protein
MNLGTFLQTWRGTTLRSPDLTESSAIPISFFLIPKGGFG